MAGPELDLLQGTLDLILLKALVWGPTHGYAVARWVRETTGDDIRVEEGALYTALHRMEKRGWVRAEWGLSENKPIMTPAQDESADASQIKRGGRARRPAGSTRACRRNDAA